MQSHSGGKGDSGAKEKGTEGPGRQSTGPGHQPKWSRADGAIMAKAQTSLMTLTHEHLLEKIGITKLLCTNEALPGRRKCW